MLIYVSLPHNDCVVVKQRYLWGRVGRRQPLFWQSQNIGLQDLVLQTPTGEARGAAAACEIARSHQNCSNVKVGSKGKPDKVRDVH